MFRLTKDFIDTEFVNEEFKSKVQEIRKAEESIHILKNILNKICIHKSEIKSCLNFIPDLIDTLMDKDSNAEIIEVHKKILTSFENIYSQIEKISMNDLDNYLVTINQRINEREMLRINYQQHEDKIENLFRNKDFILSKNDKECKELDENLNKVKNLIKIEINEIKTSKGRIFTSF